MFKLWACEENFLKSYLAKIESVDADKIKAFDLGSVLEKKDIMEISDGKAFININGVLSNEPASFIEKMFGIQKTEYVDIRNSIAKAEADKDVKEIVFNFNTPGGSVDGVDETWQAIMDCEKKTTAINCGLMASAGYYLASGCEKIYSKSDANETGSIGVVVEYVDSTKAMNDAGYEVKTFLSSNAENKRLDTNTEKGYNKFIERLDSAERIFHDRISKGRGVSVEKIKKDFGRGGVFIAKDPDTKKPDAISVGMIDGTIKEKNMSETKKDFSDLEAKVSGLKKELQEAKATIEASEKQAKIIKKASVYLEADSTYGKAIKEMAVKVVNGDLSMDGLTGAVAVYDSMKEDKKSKEAKKDETPETPANEVKISNTGDIEAEADIQAMIKNLKGE